MTPITIGFIGIIALLVLLAIRMPVGIAMSVVGVIGIAAITGWNGALARLGSTPFEHSYNFQLSVVPLFVLMGHFAMVSGMSRDAYAAAHAWLGHWRGGLASATILACSGFAAVSGSSVASAATMGAVALPEMRKYNYDRRLATGCIAAGGTLGILIPPSTGFIFYALLTEQSIGRLFMAGVFPGLLLTALFMLTIYIQTRIRPQYAPAVPKLPLAERIRAIRWAGSLFLVVFLVIGGIYIGVFTPTEAAAVGALLTMLFAIVRGSITRDNFLDALLQTARTTAFIFLILIGAFFFGPFLAVSEIPTLLTSFIEGSNASPIVILGSILLLYIFLGMFLEGFAMIVLTLPIVFPVILKLGYDPIWFGVVMVVVMEMGLISPPVGINVFVVKGIAGKDTPMRDIFAGILPFWVALVICLAVIVLFPEVALFLPNTMFGRG
jgi:tripartite ATP-independent transporter DctM subunit